MLVEKILLIGVLSMKDKSNKDLLDNARTLPAGFTPFA